MPKKKKSMLSKFADHPVSRALDKINPVSIMLKNGEERSTRRLKTIKSPKKTTGTFKAELREGRPARLKKAVTAAAKRRKKS